VDQAVNFEASIKAMGVKPDGLEIKLKVPRVDGGLLQTLAPMMTMSALDVTIRAPVTQGMLAFTDEDVKQIEERLNGEIGDRYGRVSVSLERR